jgi:FkbM family methyltransferase
MNVKPDIYLQVKLLPYALGKEEGTVQMGIPEKDGRMHHGMTKIASSAQENYVQFFDVEMKNPDELFAELRNLDFIKCDVEGYESMVFSNFQKTITKFQPLVQSELSGEENRKTVIALFESLGYSCTILDNGTLRKINLPEAMLVSQDFYFVPNSKFAQYV